MNTAQNGKGDKPRKGASLSKFQQGWDAIKKRNHESALTPAIKVNGESAGTQGDTSGDPD